MFIGGGVYAGMEPADGQQEVGVAAPVDAQRHVAGEREDEHARVVERGVELELSLLEVHAADEVHLQIERAELLGRQLDAQHAEDGERRARDLEQQPDLEADERRACPIRACPSARSGSDPRAVGRRA